MPTPYDAFTDSSDVITSYILNLLKTNPTVLQVQDAVLSRAFYYGEQQAYPTSPAFCVTPGPESSVYNGIGGRPVMITFTTYVMVYIDILRDIQQNTQQATQLPVVIKHIVHADKNLGGNVIDCFCSNVEPGYAMKAGKLIAASRITFRSRAKKLLNP